MQKHKYVRLQSIYSIYNHTAGVNPQPRLFKQQDSRERNMSTRDCLDNTARLYSDMILNLHLPLSLRLLSLEQLQERKNTFLLLHCSFLLSNTLMQTHLQQ